MASWSLASILCAVIALTALAAAPATAQLIGAPTLQVHAAAPSGPVAPGGHVLLEASVTVETVCLPDEADADLLGFDAMVSHAVRSDAQWLAVHVFPYWHVISIDLLSCIGGGYSETYPVTILAEVRDDAPALETTHIDIDARLESGSQTVEAVADVLLQAGFGGSYRALLEPPILFDVPSEQTFVLPVLVDNRANGALSVQLTADVEDSLLQVATPGPQVVPTGHSARLVMDGLFHAGPGNLTVLTITVRAVSADDPAASFEDQTMSIVLRAVAADEVDPWPESPAGGAILPGLTVIALAALLRRRIGLA